MNMKLDTQCTCNSDKKITHLLLDVLSGIKTGLEPLFITDRSWHRSSYCATLWQYGIYCDPESVCHKSLFYSLAKYLNIGSHKEGDTIA